MKQKQTIELTQKQFIALLKTVYIGNWVANAQTIPSKGKGDEYEEIENLIFSYADKFNYKKFVDHNVEDGNKFYPTRAFEEDTDVHTKIEEYEEESFWEELIDRLVRLHILKDFGKDKLSKMKKAEYWELLDKYTEKYSKEFEDNGLDRLLID